MKYQKESAVVEGLLHNSAELRRRIIEEINSGDVSVLSILSKLVTALEKSDFQLYQEKVSGLESLSKLDLRGKQGNMLPKTLKSLVTVLSGNIMLENEPTTVAAAVQATLSLGLQNHVTLHLMDQLESRCKSERVFAILEGLRALNASTPDIACRLLAVFPHLSPSGLVDIASGTVQPACLSAAIDLLRSFPIACFDDRVLCALEQLAREPKATATRHHAPTQRVLLVIAALTLIMEKYSSAIAKDQTQQEKIFSESMQRNEARLQQGKPAEAAPEPSECSVLFGNVLSTAQDCLSDPELQIRRHAARLIGAAAVGQIYAKVISQQLSTWLESSDDFQQRCAVANMIVLLFHPSPVVHRALELLETDDERIRKVI